MILIFVLGYVFIALEHKVRIDKAAIERKRYRFVSTTSASPLPTATARSTW